jgi:hypothetical protein
VRLLLDTHVFLWWRADSRHLRAPARRAIAEAQIVFVSAATAWEAAIKAALGRLRLDTPVIRITRIPEGIVLPSFSLAVAKQTCGAGTVGLALSSCAVARVATQKRPTTLVHFGNIALVL